LATTFLTALEAEEAFFAAALDATFFVVERAGLGIASFPSGDAAGGDRRPASVAGEAPEGAEV
jgi:hypothetical protein